MPAVTGRTNPVLGVTQPSEDHSVAIHSFEVSQFALDAFRAETTPTGLPNVAAVPSGQSLISLAELKAAGILFDQNDAVAIGQALCRSYIGSQLRRRMNPRWSEPDTSAPMTIESILIDGTGRVKASLGDLDDEATAVNRIGHVFGEILPDGRSFLRTKIIAKALSSPPQFKTVDELSQALSALERPDGREVIRAIYELWQRESRPAASPALPQERPAVVADPPLTPVRAEPDVPAEKGETGPLPLSRRRQLLLVAAIVGGGVTAFLIGVFVLLSWFSTGPTAPSAPAEAVTADAQAPADPQAGNQRNYVAFTGPLPPARRPAAPPSTAAAPRRVARDAAPSGATPADTPAPMIATASDVSWRPLDPRENRGARPTGVPASGTSSAPERAGGGSSTSIDDLAQTDADTERVYTAKDPDVVPPMPILPRLLAGLRPSTPGIRPDALTVAVIVAPDGSVDSVRGLVAPQSMGETVLLTEALSVVKSWRFNPATKDGRAVKYEQVVPLTTLIRAAQ
jgi:TonB-like protein